MTWNTRYTGMWPRGASKSKHTSAPADTKMGHIPTLRPELSPKGDKAQNPVDAAHLLPHSGRREGTRTAKHCPFDTHNHGTELAMKVVRQARLELSGGSTPDLLSPPPPPSPRTTPETPTWACDGGSLADPWPAVGGFCRADAVGGIATRPPFLLAWGSCRTAVSRLL